MTIVSFQKLDRCYDKVLTHVYTDATSHSYSVFFMRIIINWDRAANNIGK